MRPSLLRLAAAALAAAVLAALAGGAWFVTTRTLDKPSPTAFGWPANLTTVAGDGQRGFADGTGKAARFSDPFAVAIDSKGALYVADAGQTNRIRKIDREGRVTTLPGGFDTPSGIAIGAGGEVYVADTGANLIRKIGLDGKVATIAGDGVAGFADGPALQARFNGPVGIAVDGEGSVYVADTYNDRIRLITPDGRVSTLAGGAAPGFADGRGAAAAFNTPCGLALDSTGALLIADMGNDAIRRLGKDGVVTTLASHAPDDPDPILRAPIGLAATQDGYLYIATFYRGRILQMSPGGALRVLTGEDAWAPESRALQLVRPAGLAVGRKGELYVAEAARYAVRKLSQRRPGEAAVAVEIVPGAPALMSARVVPWPVGPQLMWREVVGDVGEVRGNYRGESRDHFHAGLDVQAGVGETVLAMTEEKVQSPLASRGFGGLGESLQIDQLTYVHMQVGRTPSGEPLDPARFQLVRDPDGKLLQVRVKRGTRFRLGDALGSVNRMAHVHLELGARGGDANPIALRLPGLTDQFTPRISGVGLFDAGGTQLTEQQQGRLLVSRGAGPFSIVVDAWDQVDRNAARRRLGLYRLGYQILDAAGAPVKGFEQPLITIEFDRLPPDPDAPKIAYAPDSGDTVHSAQATRFLYVVSNRVRGGRAETVGWSPADLPPGDYTVRIFAADYAGNEAVWGKDLPITLR